MTLTSPIGRVAVGTEQQRNMIVLRGVLNLKLDLHDRIESSSLRRLKVGGDLEGEAVDAEQEAMMGRKKVPHSSVGVSNAPAEKLPVAGVGQTLQNDGDALCRSAQAGVENVGGDSAHGFSNFLRRNRVIFFCSSAAIASSLSGSLGRRDCSKASISSALLPVAQTMKI